MNAYGIQVIDAQNMAFGGVAKPMNEVVWRVSTLNLANRNAENAAMSRAIRLHQPMMGLR